MKKITYLIATLIFYYAPCHKGQLHNIIFTITIAIIHPVMFELGASVGVMNCLTDVGGKSGLGKPFVKDLNIGNNQFNGSIYFSSTFKEAVGLRVEGSFGQVKAYDSILKDVQSTTPRL